MLIASTISEFVEYALIELKLDYGSLAKVTGIAVPTLRAIADETIELDDLTVEAYNSLISLEVDNRVPYHQTYIYKSFWKDGGTWEEAYQKIAKRTKQAKPLEALTLRELKKMLVATGQQADKVENYFNIPLQIQFYPYEVKRMAEFIAELIERDGGAQVEANTGIPRSTLSSYLEKRVDVSNIGVGKIMNLCDLASITVEEWRARIYGDTTRKEINNFAEANSIALNLDTIRLNMLAESIATELKEREVARAVRKLASIILQFKEDKELSDIKLARKLRLTAEELQGIKDYRFLPPPQKLMGIARAGIQDIKGDRYTHERLKALLFDEL